jgi:predicted phosphodiesterase
MDQGQAALRILILSDLHLEFGPCDLPFSDADVIALAGDIGVGVRGLEWIKSRFPGRRVVYVPGNHEYYGDAMPKLTEKLVGMGHECGVDVLNRGDVEIDGVRFFGATLWTDFALWGDIPGAMSYAQQMVTDYKRVRVSPRFSKLRPLDTASQHGLTRRWLQRHADAGNLQNAVVLTHHAPSARSLAAPETRDPIDAAYASNLDSLIEASGARLWIHGHTHHCVRYRIGATEIVSNQRGYVDEPVPQFDPTLVLEM